MYITEEIVVTYLIWR